ncbi:MAG: hypothetical protein ACK5P7_13220 [Bdellovibrio sp.]
MLELEIQSLLILHGNADGAARALSEKYRSSPLTLAQSELISTFFLHAGLSASLLDFLCGQIELGSPIPWGHFVEALAMADDRLDQEILTAMLQGAEEQSLGWHLARSHVMDSFGDSMTKERELRRRALNEKALHLKRELLLQIDTLRSQEMDEQEGRLLEKVLKMFPRDPQIQDQFTEHRSRKALRLLESKMSKPDERNFEDYEAELDPESLQILQAIQGSMKTYCEESGRQGAVDPELKTDFGVAHMMWENPNGTLSFVTPPESESAIWLRLQALLRTRRYVELLADLVELEKTTSANPDATIAITYLRSQALWGLGRRFEAIDLMEGLVNIKPNYMAGVTLLAVWRGRAR